MLPLGPCVPAQPEMAALVLPDARQLVALLDDQVSEVVPYAGTVLAPRVITGVPGAVSVGVAFNMTEVGADGPPRLLQTSVNVSLPTTMGVTV